MQWLKDLIYGFLYLILNGLCRIVDFCQILVKKLAGIDTEGMLYGNQIVNGSENSSTVTGDIVEILIRSDIVRNLFISLLVLGIILLLIVTFVAVWKTEWEFGKDGNSKTKIFNSAFKALFNFIAVPVVAFFGIFVGNALLRAIDGATKGDTNRSMTSFVRSSAFANATRYEYRYEGDNNKWINANLAVVYKTDADGNKIQENGQYVIEYQGILNYFKSGSNNEIQVDQILKAFQNNAKISKQTALDKKYRVLNSDGSDAGYTYALEQGEFTFSFDDSTLTTMFFDNSKINYIMMYIVLFFMIKAMLSITFGLVKRLYYVVILFIISPPVVAMSPINDKALGEWRKMFIANVCSAFVTIGIYNIFLSIYPAFEKIKFPGVPNIINFFASLLMVAVGLLTIDGLSGSIAKWFGINELVAESTDKGKSLWGNAFRTAGTGFLPLSLGAQAIGKGVQYGMTARYQGLGAAAKQFGGDVKGGAEKLIGKTPIKDMVGSSGLNNVIGQAKANQKIKSDLKVKETSKGIKYAHGEAINSFKNAASELGYSTKFKDRKSVYESIKNNTDGVNRENYQKIWKPLMEVSAIQNRNEEQEKLYDKLTNDFNALPQNMRENLEKNHDKYAAQQQLIQSYEDAKATQRFGTLATQRMVRENNNVNQATAGGKAKAESTKAAIARQTAIRDANKKLIEEEMNKAQANIAQAKAKTDKAEAEKIIKTTQQSVDELKKKIGDQKELEKLDKKLEQVLEKLNKKK